MRFDQTKLMRGPSTWLRTGLLLLAAITLSSCGGGGGGSAGGGGGGGGGAPTTYYSISVTVTGLSGTLVLHNNRNLSADPLTFTTPSSATFTTKIASGTPYSVSVPNQPINEFCTVTNGSGTATANVTNVAVNCVPAFSIGGTFDLAGGGVAPGIGLVLQNNNADNLSVPASATAFTFNTKLMTAGSYAVTVLSQPRSPSQQCTVTAGSGGPIGGSIASVLIKCLTAPLLTDVPRFAYVANADDTVSIYTVNAATGQLRPNGYVYVGSGTTLNSVAADPSGKFLYVMNAYTSNITAYTIDPNTGKLTALSSGIGNPFSVGSTSFPGSGTVDPSGRFAYVTNGTSNDVSAYSIDLGTGALTRVPCLGGQGAGCSGVAPSYLNYPVNFTAGGGTPTSVAVHPTGQYAYVTNSGGVSVYGVDSYGALTPTSNTAAGIGPNSISITPSGLYAYVANAGGTVSAYTITAGALTSNGITSLAGKTLRSVSVDPYGSYAFVVNNTDNKVSAYAINGNGTLGTHLNTPGTAAGTGPVAVSVDPSGKYAYVANSVSADVSAYTIDPTTGLISAGSIRARSGSNSIAVTKGLAPVTNAPYPVLYKPLYAYVANSGSVSVSAYTITAGVLAKINCPAGPTCTGTDYLAGTGPTAVAVDPFGRYAYVVNSTSKDISNYEITAGTGVLNWSFTSAAMALSPTSVTVDPSGRFVYVTSSGDAKIWGYSLNPASFGDLTSIDTDFDINGFQSFITTGAGPSSVTIDPTGRFAYVTNSTDATVSAYLIMPSSGAWSKIPCTGGLTLCDANLNFLAGTNPSSVTVDPTGKFAYVVNNGGPSVSAFSIVAGTGALSVVGPITTVAGPTSIAVDPTGRFAYVAHSTGVSAYPINPTTGALGTLVGTYATGVPATSVTVDISGTYVYVSHSNGVTAYTINNTTPGGTGALTLLTGVLGTSTYLAGTTPASVTTTGTIQ